MSKLWCQGRINLKYMDDNFIEFYAEKYIKLPINHREHRSFYMYLLFKHDQFLRKIKKVDRRK